MKEPGGGECSLENKTIGSPDGPTLCYNFPPLTKIKVSRLGDWGRGNLLGTLITREPGLLNTQEPLLRGRGKIPAFLPRRLGVVVNDLVTFLLSSTFCYRGEPLPNSPESVSQTLPP